MSPDPAEPENPSRRYWKAAIGSLTPEKRDAAWEFYLTHLAEGNTGDTLSAIVLLLEANGVFLEQLPERYHEELILPLRTQLVSLQQRLTESEERQREVSAAVEHASRLTVEATSSALATAVRVENSLRQAATAVDTRAVVESVKKQILEGALLPMTKKLEDLTTHTTRIDEATKAAQRAVKTWRRVHLGGIVLAGWGVALVIFLILSIFVFIRLERQADRELGQFRENLLAEVKENQETLRRLAESGISMRIVPLAGSDGKPQQNSLAIIVEPAEGADFDARDGQRRGVVYFKPAVKAHIPSSSFR